MNVQHIKMRKQVDILRWFLGLLLFCVGVES
jgi:hypothetical protein